MIASANPRNGSINFGSGATGVEFFPVTHIGTFQGLSTTLANTYRDYDVALRDSIDNARRMRNDCGLMECLEARQRAVALLPWTIEPEDQKSQLQKRLCREMTRILARTPRFTEFRRSLLEAIWYGKYGVKVTYNREQVRRNERFVISSGEDCPDVPAWVPINGDKIVFRHDDRSRLDASRGQYPFQVGIRVGLNWKETDAISQNDRILGKYIPEKIQSNYRGAEAVDRGMAYFLDREDRKNVIIHKHTIEDGSYEDMLSAGSIHGMGIRSRIYWDWVQLQEVTAWLIAYIERTHGGMEIYKYPLGNQAAKDEIDTMIANRAPGRSALKVPVPNGEDASQFGVEVVEAGMSGVSFLMELMKDYYGHRIKRYILGQTLSTEAGSTGLGSGVADLHLETFLQILKYDAVNFDDSMSNQVLRWLQIANFPASKGILLRYKTVTEDSEKQEKMKALQSAWEMGARVKESDVYEVCGLSAPGPNDRILQIGQSAPAANQSLQDGFHSTQYRRLGRPQKFSQQWNEQQHPRQNDGKFAEKGSAGIPAPEVKGNGMNLSAKQLAQLVYLKQTGQKKFLADMEKNWNAGDWESHLSRQPEDIRRDVADRVAKKAAQDSSAKTAAQIAAEQVAKREAEIEAEQDRIADLSGDQIDEEFNEKYGDTNWSELVASITSARDSLINEDLLKDHARSLYEEGLDEDEIAGRLAESLDSDESEEQEREQEEDRDREVSEQRSAEERRRKDPDYISSTLKVHAEFAARELKNKGLDRHDIRKLTADVQASELHGTLVKNGWTPEYISDSGSTYYRRGERRLRVSDHEVPETLERIHNKQHGGFSWAGSGADIILPVDDLADLPIDIE